MSPRKETEEWQTDGPSKVKVTFDFNREWSMKDGLVFITVKEGMSVMTINLDVQEFKSLLKAGLRFDERISP